MQDSVQTVRVGERDPYPGSAGATQFPLDLALLNVRTTDFDLTSAPTRRDEIYSL